jgi:hypothetical protein
MLSDENRIERNIGKIKRQDRRNGGKSRSQCCLRHADRAEIVGVTIVPVSLSLLLMKERREQHTGSGFLAAEVFQMNVTKRQRKVYRERQQRQRRNLPYLGTKPLHSETNLTVSRARAIELQQHIGILRAVNLAAAAELHVGDHASAFTLLINDCFSAKLGPTQMRNDGGLWGLIPPEFVIGWYFPRIKRSASELAGRA